MRRHKLYIFLVPAIIALIMAWASCRSATEVDDIGCDANTEVDLKGLFFEINGEATGDDNLMLTNEDTLGIFYRYEDAECNVDGAKIYFKVDQDEWSVEKILPDGTPCSSDEPGAKVGFGKKFPDLEPGLHSFFTGWVDDCGIRTDEIQGQFEILGEGDDDDIDQGEWGVIENGGFEDGTANWSETFGPIITNNATRVFEGKWAAQFSGSGTVRPRIKQAFTVPANAKRLDLTFYYNVISDETSQSPEDKLLVQLTDSSGNQVYHTFTTISNLASGGNFQEYFGFKTVTSGLAGYQVYLSFQSDFDEDADTTDFIIDNVTLMAE